MQHFYAAPVPIPEGTLAGCGAFGMMQVVMGDAITLKLAGHVMVDAVIG
jgi:hypothetical protein